MGYSEVRCVFCAVSFNIGRIRRYDEPREASYYTSYGYSGECEAKNGCWYIPSAATGRHGFGGLKTYSEEETEDEAYLSKIESDLEAAIKRTDEDDISYEYESDNVDEAYEYESDDDLVDDLMKDQVTSSEDSSDDGDDIYEKWLEPFKNPEAFKLREKKPQNPIPITQDTFSADIEKHWEYCEHIAGPDCTSRVGYNGHRVSLEEMKGCRTFQCLLPKPSNWVPSNDDEEFEIEGDYFLSGLGIDMPSRDENYPLVFPVRHGAEEIHPEDWLVDHETAMPFHATCFEVYKHISRQKWRKVEILGLMNWYRGHGHLNNIPNDAVSSCSGQWWQHLAGTEWLVANPVFVPLLPEIFRSATTEHEISPHSEAFPLRVLSNRGPVFDPFGRLPMELSQLILSYLPSSDIASLRLVSRAFEQLPISLFHRLLQEEMPWLWEVWSDEPPSFWTTTSKPELVALERKKVEYEEDLQVYRQVIKEEIPEMYDNWVASEPSFDDFRGSRRAVPSYGLLTTRTNWYELYRAITANWKDLKGLQNRRRIWGCVSHIVEQLRCYPKK